MSRTNVDPISMNPHVRHSAAQAEAIRLLAEHDGRALRVVEKRLEDQMAKGDFIAALHLD